MQPSQTVARAYVTPPGQSSSFFSLWHCAITFNFALYRGTNAGNIRAAVCLGARRFEAIWAQIRRHWFSLSGVHTRKSKSGHKIYFEEYHRVVVPEDPPADTRCFWPWYKVKSAGYNSIYVDGRILANKWAPFVQRGTVESIYIGEQPFLLIFTPLHSYVLILLQQIVRFPFCRPNIDTYLCSLLLLLFSVNLSPSS